jgi:deazaflavin-dependent oxidoreductase (nitroreductase family)
MGDSLVITVTGRKTGRLYSVPVNYSQSGDKVTIISRRDRTWWRNLRGGAEVILRQRGRDVRGRATVIEDDEGVVTALTDFTQQLSRVPRRLRDVREAAATRVVIHVQLCS